jgi:hypothetical protein
MTVFIRRSAARPMGRPSLLFRVSPDRRVKGESLTLQRHLHEHE